MTFLSDVQLREAEDAFRRIAGGQQGLLFHVDYALNNYRPPTFLKTLEEAVDGYLASKETEQVQGIISPSMLTTIKRHMAFLKKNFRGVNAAT